MAKDRQNAPIPSAQFTIDSTVQRVQDVEWGTETLPQDFTIESLFDGDESIVAASASIVSTPASKMSRSNVERSPFRSSLAISSASSPFRKTPLNLREREPSSPHSSTPLLSSTNSPRSYLNTTETPIPDLSSFTISSRANLSSSPNISDFFTIKPDFGEVPSDTLESWSSNLETPPRQSKNKNMQVTSRKLFASVPESVAPEPISDLVAKPLIPESTTTTASPRPVHTDYNHSTGSDDTDQTEDNVVAQAKPIDKVKTITTTQVCTMMINRYKIPKPDKPADNGVTDINLSHEKLETNMSENPVPNEPLPKNETKRDKLISEVRLESVLEVAIEVDAGWRASLGLTQDLFNVVPEQDVNVPVVSCEAVDQPTTIHLPENEFPLQDIPVSITQGLFTVEQDRIIPTEDMDESIAPDAPAQEPAIFNKSYTVPVANNVPVVTIKVTGDSEHLPLSVLSCQVPQNNDLVSCEDPIAQLAELQAPKAAILVGTQTIVIPAQDRSSEGSFVLEEDISFENQKTPSKSTALPPSKLIFKYPTNTQLLPTQLPPHKKDDTQSLKTDDILSTQQILATQFNVEDVLIAEAVEQAMLLEGVSDCEWDDAGLDSPDTPRKNNVVQLLKDEAGSSKKLEGLEYQAKVADKPNELSEFPAVLGLLKTGGGKAIALKQPSKNVFEGMDFLDLKGKGGQSAVPKIEKKAEEKSSKRDMFEKMFFSKDADLSKLEIDPAEMLPSASVLNKDPSATIKGFETASGKYIKVISKSIFTEDFSDLKALNGFPNRGCDSKLVDDQASTEGVQPFIGFKTAAGSKISVKAKSIFTEDFSDLKDMPSFSGFSDSGFSSAASAVPPPVGFSTAGGKKVTVSETSLDFIKSQVPRLQPDPNTSKQTKSKIEMLDELINTGLSADQDMFGSKDLLNVVPASGPFEGFKTAAGSEISIKTASIFTEDFSDLKDMPLFGFASAGVSTTANETAHPLLGFSTAGGKKVTISDETFDFIKFQRPRPSSPDPPVKPKTFNTGFITAGGAQVVISEESLDVVQSQRSGFSTAAGKKVEVSDQALEFGKMPSSGFSTAGGVRVTISDKALNHIRSSQRPAGFSTASGNDVKISDKSLDFVRSQVPVAGFSTGLGTQVKVSDESLDFIKSQCPTEPKGLSNVTPKTPKTPCHMPLKKKGGFVKHNRDNITPQRSKPSPTKPSAVATTPKLTIPKPELTTPVIIKTDKRKSDESHSKASFESPAIRKDKRRRLSRGVAFHSPVTPRTKLAITCSPRSNNDRFGMVPLTSSPHFESTLVDNPVEQTSFITPYNPGPAEEKEEKVVRGKVLWRGGAEISTKGFVAPALSTDSVSIQTIDLPYGLHDKAKLYELGVSSKALNVRADNAHRFVFSKPDYFTHVEGDTVQYSCGARLLLVEGGAGALQFHHALLTLPNIKTNLISEQWTENHYRLIVWKCSAQEVTLPHTFGGRVFSPENVLIQLTRRYWVEVEEGRRSCIRRITEKDDHPRRPIVLCVSGLDRITKAIEVTDGWYTLEAPLDPPLWALVQQGRLAVGTKFISFSAQLNGGDDGAPPLQAKGVVTLKLNYNSLRPVEWSAPLGFYNTANQVPTLPLSALVGEGGVVRAVDVVILRRYALQYMETLHSGSKTFHNERYEHRRQALYDKQKQSLIDKIQTRMSRDLVEKREKRKVTKDQLKGLESGCELYAIVNSHPDPSSLHVFLSSSQRNALQQYTERENSKKREELNRDLLEELAETLPARKVTQILKLRVSCAYHGNVTPLSYQLSVWRPGEEARAVLKEGYCVRLHFVGTSNYRGGVSLSSARNTVYQALPGDYTTWGLRHVCYVSKVPGSIKECDIAGRVLDVTTLDKYSDVLLGDLYSVTSVRVNGDLDMLCVREMLQQGTFLTIQNLQCYKDRLVADERASFSACPKDPALLKLLADLKEQSEEFWAKLKTSYQDAIEFELPSDGIAEILQEMPIECFEEMPEEMLLDPFDEEISVPISKTQISSTSKSSSSSRASSSKENVPLFSRNESVAKKRRLLDKTLSPQKVLKEVEFNISATVKNEFNSPFEDEVLFDDLDEDTLDLILG